MENVVPIMDTPTLSDERFSEKAFKPANENPSIILSRASIHNNIEVKQTKTILVNSVQKKTLPPTNFDALYATIKKPTIEMFTPEGEFIASYRRGFMKSFNHDIYSKELETELSKECHNPQELLLTLSNMLIHFAYSLTDPIKYVLCFYKVILD